MICINKKNNNNLKNKKRIYAIDTIKAILIFLVVLGHLLELNLTGKAKFAYCFIYMFHMPLFVLLSGYFFKFEKRKFIKRIIMPYFIFQTIYTIFNCLYLQKHNIVFNYTKPYWIMWYLLAYALWGIFATIFDTKNLKQQIIVIAALFIIGVLIGFDDSIEYYLTLSRFFVFLPFFMLGYYSKNWTSICNNKDKMKKNFKIIIGIVLLIIVGIVFYYIFTQYKNWQVSWLYGSFPYSKQNYSFIFRIMQYVFAISIISFILWIIPNRKNLLNCIGKNTLIIYILHGFIIKIIDNEDLLKFNTQYEFYLKILIIAMLIVLPFTLLSIGINKLKEMCFSKIKLKKQPNTITK